MLFSILITAFNSEDFIELCIDSVLCQLEDDCEIIIVDDCSFDQTPKILESYLNIARVKILTNKKNYGQAYSLNIAFAASIGQYLLFLDSDDLFRQDKLIYLREYLKERVSSGLIQHDLMEIDKSGKSLGSQFGVNTSATGCRLLGGDVLAEILNPANPYSWYFAPTSGLCLRRDFAEQIFPLPNHFKICADVPIAYCASLKGGVALITEPLGFYRLHSASGYASQISLNKAAWEAEQFINTLERYSLLFDLKQRNRFDVLKECELPDIKSCERFWEFYYRFLYPCRLTALLENFRRRVHSYRIGEVDLWYVVAKFMDDILVLSSSAQVNEVREAFYARFHRLSSTSRLLLSEH